MVHSELISWLALFSSLVSLACSIYFNLRDRAAVMTRSRVINDWYGGLASLEISIINKGRRAIILRMWGGTDGTVRWVGTVIGKNGEGSRLGEHERFSVVLSMEDLEGDTTPDESIEFSDLWFEDTLGTRYFVEGARRHIAELRAIADRRPRAPV
jgi:hypothetical protein